MLGEADERGAAFGEVGSVRLVRKTTVENLSDE